MPGAQLIVTLDRYAARYANFVLVVTRMAVLEARRARPRGLANQPRLRGDIKGGVLGWFNALEPIAPTVRFRPG